MCPCVHLLNEQCFSPTVCPDLQQGRAVACPFIVIPANAGTQCPFIVIPANAGTQCPQCPQCPKMTEDTHYKVFRIMETNPSISQRELAAELGVSLGKANYCIKALIDKGLVKANNSVSYTRIWQ